MDVAHNDIRHLFFVAHIEISIFNGHNLNDSLFDIWPFNCFVEDSALVTENGLNEEFLLLCRLCHSEHCFTRVRYVISSLS